MHFILSLQLPRVTRVTHVTHEIQTSLLKVITFRSIFPPINCKETVPFKAEVCAQRCMTPNPQSTATRLKPHGYKGYPGTLTHDSYSLVPTKGYSKSSYFRVRPIKGRDGVCVMGCLD